VTVSELAFLALGLLLGVASGAALIVVLGSRPMRREIKVTITRDAVPRRSETLSQGSMATSPAEPAQGGPGDRRIADREGDSRITVSPGGPSQTDPPARPQTAPARPSDRTAVPSVNAPIGIAIRPEPDPALDALRSRTAQGAAMERILRGDHRAMTEALDAIAGPDGRRRRDWEILLGEFVEALSQMAMRESVIDFPMGTAFWDTFTIGQCRRIVGALASMGFEYDGRAGWREGRAPAYRDLTVALSDVGIEPRRIRAWPNQVEIAALFEGARPAPEELLAAAGPDYGVDEVRELVADRGTLAGLWPSWDAVRPILFETAGVETPSEG
jgi:hypothetical protein